MRIHAYLLVVGFALLGFMAAVVYGEEPAENSKTESSNEIERMAQVVDAVGVVRHFHPHEAVTVVDWNRILHHGFELAETANSDAEFAESLVQMLSFLGYGIELNATDVSQPLGCAASKQPARWVHQGLSFDPAVIWQGPYSSQIEGADIRIANPNAIGATLTSLDANDLRGKELVYRGEARLPDGGESVLWIRVDDAEGAVLSFNNMNDERFDSSEWTAQEIVINIDDQANRISLGTIVYGDFSAEFQNLRLSISESEQIAVEPKSLLPPPEEWQLTMGHSQFDFDAIETASAMDISLSAIESRASISTALSNELDQAPNNWNIELIDDSVLQIPIALCPEHAMLEDSAIEQLKQRFSPLDVNTLEISEQVRLDLATLWPVIQHFYPYREQLDDWGGELAFALRQAESINSRQAHQHLLQRLLAKIDDGHVHVYETDSSIEEDRYWLPIAVLEVDGNIFIASVKNDAANVAVGDRIVSIDDEPIDEWMESNLALYSGSSQWRSYRALENMLSGGQGDLIRFDLERDGEILQSSLAFNLDQQLEPYGPGYEPTTPLGIAYLDLRGLDNEQWFERLPDLVKADGVIFDLRGYPGQAGVTMLSNLMNAPDSFKGWMQVLAPRQPNGDLIVAESLEWNIQAVEPRIKAPVAFLTDYSAISYAESVLGMVKHHEIGTIVGSNTAGANGNIILLELPSGFNAVYTGMRVLGPDGKPFHAIGLEPDIVATPSVEGIKQGRDEVLERAIQYLTVSN